jgi:hypothetical protein
MGQNQKDNFVFTCYVPSRRRPPNCQHLQFAVHLVYKNLFGFEVICMGGAEIIRHKNQA